MPPFGDTVGFVDSEAGDVDLGEELLELGTEEGFGGDVEEFGVALADLVEVPLVFGVAEGAVEGDGVEAEFAQLHDLVFHEGDEGRDDDGEAIEEEGGELVAE